MPIENQQDASDVDAYIDRIFNAISTRERKHAITSLLAEKLDFEPIIMDQFIELGNKTPINAKLPPVAHNVAKLDDVYVFYIDLAESDIPTKRVRKIEASATAELILRELNGDPLLIFTNRDNSQIHFIFPSFDGVQPVLRRMVIERDIPRRTAIQQISNIYWEYQARGSIYPALNSAFDVEAVTNAFFKEYKRIFDSSFEKISGFGDSEEELKHKEMYILTLFNRLMFIYFVSRKGWMRFRGDNDYLNALWKDYKSSTDETNFYEDRLKSLFFYGLDIPDARHLKQKDPMLYAKIGDVPFLNGGLFEKSDLDGAERDIQVPDDVIESIFKELFDKFNFTVMESTPLDIGVAVDPEMLGKVFEELVTERHESGAYYTPRPVVSFMCREALKGYLTTHNNDIDSAAISEFVDKRDTSKLSVAQARRVSRDLDEIKVVDPACGSGAYLLGMMQELVELYVALYDDQLKSDARSLYRLKLEIIKCNLHGVDNDPFAVNIAMLRLWLALSIEFEPDDEHDDPDALPNLDFKIVCGDSLLGIDPGQNNLDRELIRKSDLNALKSQFMGATDSRRKDMLKHKIADVEDQLKAERGDAVLPNSVVDWLINFAEVFGPHKGFDVVVANPPYVRQEKIDRDVKPKLRSIYVDSTVARADLYCYFYVRALQLLRDGGMHIFVCSNSWLDVGYGAKLQKHLLENAHVQAVYESAIERQFSTAQINTIISVIHKNPDKADDSKTRFISLRGEFEKAMSDSDLQQERAVEASELATSDKWGSVYLRAPDIYHVVLNKGKDKLVRLGDIATVKFGLKTGANDFFYLSRDDIDKWGIEDEYLKLVMPSPQESRSILVEPLKLPNKLFMCHKEKDDLSGTGALEYINWGESQGYHQRRSVTSRRRWYDLGDRPGESLAVNVFVDTTVRTVFSRQEILFSHNFKCLVPAVLKPEQLCFAMNSTPYQLVTNTEGRSNFGEGVLEIQTYETANSKVVDPSLLPEIDEDIFRSTDWDVLSPSPERRLIDDAVFDVLGLTQGERDGVYEGVRELVQNRKRRAKSV